MAKILIVGSANIDLVTRVSRVPKPGETLIGQSFDTVSGGKGANQATAAARLDAETWFAGCVGNDAFGEMQQRNMAAEGINLTYLKVHPTEPTGTAVILVAEEGQNSIVVTPAANMGITPEDIEGMARVFESIDTVLVQLEIPLQTVEATLDMARRYGVLSIVDAGPAQQVPDAIIKKADIISPNETEAEAITGVHIQSVDDARKAGAELLERGARRAVVKLGAMGALYIDDKEWVHVPAFSIAPVDSTAAGDAFTAALALAWKEQRPSDAIEFANAAGALATTVAGAQPSMPTRAAVENFLNQQG
ncbi:MAG: ribokinase [Candidatus Hydrogenedentes bacterium]|nr:ribokinase [Candidatus Hydrogenedentota bacterium]